MKMIWKTIQFSICTTCEETLYMHFVFHMSITHFYCIRTQSKCHIEVSVHKLLHNDFKCVHIYCILLHNKIRDFQHVKDKPYMLWHYSVSTRFFFFYKRNMFDHVSKCNFPLQHNIKWKWSCLIYSFIKVHWRRMVCPGHRSFIVHWGLPQFIIFLELSFGMRVV